MSSENVEHHLVKENVFDELDTNSLYIITRMRACNGLMQKLHTHSLSYSAAGTITCRIATTQTSFKHPNQHAMRRGLLLDSKPRVNITLGNLRAAARLLKNLLAQSDQHPAHVEIIPPAKHL
jgi:hypothetical protein